MNIVFIYTNNTCLKKVLITILTGTFRKNPAVDQRLKNLPAWQAISDLFQLTLHRGQD